MDRPNIDQYRALAERLPEGDRTRVELEALCAYVVHLEGQVRALQAAEPEPKGRQLTRPRQLHAVPRGQG